MTEDEMAGWQHRLHVSLGELQELVMDREAWSAVIHGVPKSRTRLSDWTELNWMLPVKSPLILYHRSIWVTATIMCTKTPFPYCLIFFKVISLIYYHISQAIRILTVLIQTCSRSMVNIKLKPSHLQIQLIKIIQVFLLYDFKITFKNI